MLSEAIDGARMKASTLSSMARSQTPNQKPHPPSMTRPQSTQKPRQIKRPSRKDVFFSYGPSHADSILAVSLEKLRTMSSWLLGKPVGGA
jgi:hypothetical protein